MSTANKLTYLNTTKGKIKDAINLTGANILSEDTFRSYADKLKQGLVDAINDGGSTIYSNFPKTTGEGTEIALNDTYEAPMEIGLNGNTEQDGEPTPDVPVDVKVVTGDNTINICGKNLFDKDNANIKLGRRMGLNGVSIVANDYFISDYIEIKPSTQYSVNYTMSVYTRIAYYDKDKIFISDNSSSATFTTPSNAKYLILGNLQTELNNVQLEKGSTATDFQPYQGKDYEINLGNIELCKIVDYQDIIFHAINGDSFYDTLDNATKQTLTYGKWYKHSEIGKVVLDGSENWQVLANVTLHSYYVDNFANALSTTNTKNYYSNYFVAIKTDDRYIDKTFFINAFSRIIITYDSISTLASFKSWLNTHNTIVYYVLTTPTNTEITDTTLINQLEELEKAKSVDDKTFISQINEQLPFILDLSALSKN